MRCGETRFCNVGQKAVTMSEYGIVRSRLSGVTGDERK
jgi:hypothetical protein